MLSLVLCKIWSYRFTMQKRSLKCKFFLVNNVEVQQFDCRHVITSVTKKYGGTGLQV
jgi:hypothetical protein